MFCNNCGAKNNQNGNFCGSCGSKVDSGIENKVDSSEFKETMSKFTYVGDFISTLRKTSNVGATVYLIANIIFLRLFISVAMDDG